MTEKEQLRPIGQKSIVEQIIDSIMDAIVGGVYRPGTKLPSEFELMEQMQVGRNSLREAMKVLSAMGIVEIKRGDGTYISTQMNASAFDRVIYSMVYDAATGGELLELRQVLDEATVRLAMEKITPEECALLQESIAAMRLAAQKGDVAQMQGCDMAFHMGLIESCKNAFFIRIMKGVYSVFERSIGENIRIEQVDSRAPDYHQRLLDCVRGKDHAAVAAAVADSLRTWKDRV